MISLPEFILEQRELWTQKFANALPGILFVIAAHPCEPGNLSHHSPPNHIFPNLKLVFLSGFPRIASDSNWQAPGRFELCIHFVTVCTIQMHFFPLKMRVGSRLLDIYTDARQNHQLSSFQKAKYHHVIPLFRGDMPVYTGNTPVYTENTFRGVWALCWQHIWLLLVAVCAECGEWWLFPPVHCPRWLNVQMECPAPACPFQVEWDPRRSLLELPSLNKVSCGIL